MLYSMLSVRLNTLFFVLVGFVPGGEIQPWGVSWPRARAVFWGEDHGAPKVDVVLAGVLATQRLNNGQGCSAGQRHLNFSS